VIAKNMRESDKAELQALGISQCPLPLMAGFNNSSVCLTIDAPSLGPVAIFGVIGKIDEPACVWLLGTDGIAKIQKAFFKISKEFVRAFLLLHPVLENYIDARSKATIKWLKMLGAEIEDAAPYGVNKIPFSRFCFRREPRV